MPKPVVHAAGQQGGERRRRIAAPQLGGQIPVVQVQAQVAAGLLVAGEGGEQYDPENRLNAQILNVSDASVLSVVPGVGLREFLFNGVF